MSGIDDLIYGPMVPPNSRIPGLSYSACLSCAWGFCKDGREPPDDLKNQAVQHGLITKKCSCGWWIFWDITSRGPVP